MRSRVVSVLVYFFYRLLASTWKIRAEGFDSFIRPLMDSKNPFILAHWHEDEWALTRFFSFRKMNVLVSNSRDGQAMALFLKWMGYQVSRGSSTRGGVRGLLDFIKSVKKSANPMMSFAVDGPKGPRRVPKDGIFFVAEKLNIPLFTIVAYTDNCWIFKRSWSKAFLPKPFAKVQIAFLPVPDPVAKGDYKEWSQKLVASMNNAKSLAKEKLRGSTVPR